MASTWSVGNPGDDAEPPSKDEPDAIPDSIAANVGEQSPAPVMEPSNPARPPLHRDQPQPPPLHQPPPPPAPTDSLSLMQLKRIVAEFPHAETLTYAFTYADTATFEEELDEWFSYNDVEFVRLRRAQSTFQRRWRKLSDKPWIEATAEVKTRFVQKQITGLNSQDLRRRCKSLQTILYIVLGVWEETAGKPLSGDADSKPRTTATPAQIDEMISGLALVAECGAVPALYDILRRVFDGFWTDAYRDSQLAEEDIPFVQDELDNVTTIMYVLIEATRNFPSRLTNLHHILENMNPKLINYLVALTAKLRWDEANELPGTRIFLLFWKSCLLFFGGSEELAEVKKATMEASAYDSNKADIITASPLDYNVFRQEITSKYPAYVPPPPLIPVEKESHSILSPVANHPSRNNGSNGIIPPLEQVNTGAGSILNQPVHIATPVPSPPPSPSVTGKAGKKQNYQTNQNFPFMYPPLDSTSSSAGGKGASCLHPLVGRKWEGSDVPASILEAGALFAGRMRMTRAMRQLWEERERFLKFQRGWDEDEDDELLDDIEDLDLEAVLEKRLNFDDKPSKTKNTADYGPREVSLKVKKKLDALEDFYRDSMPHLQSLVIVLLKSILSNVTALLTPLQAPMLQQSSSSFQMNGMNGPRRQDSTGVIEVSELTVAELEALRSREITAKAVSGIILNLLKWFKVSHVLKFEYLSQLLLDSNYVPLLLKLFAHQDVDKIVPCKADREQLSFFTFCNMNSKNYQTWPAKAQSVDSEDDAIPPPIRFRRDSQAVECEEDQPGEDALENGQSGGQRPEIDELSFPVDASLGDPVTEFSWRNFFSSINFLRIMQKICKNKAHRNLLLVQYKSSNILKKALKLPQPELRLYTLKLFKNQVPYCGRKWRQSNMRVITAIYLHCRPELRDEWLAGSDVDAEVEESLPLEQALRSLTHWYNIKRYPEEMGADVKLLAEEHNFFIRELQKMDVLYADGMDSESVWDSASVW